MKYLIHDVEFKISYSANALGIIFDKVDEYIRRYDKN